MPTTIEHLHAKAKSNLQRIIFPEAYDPRVTEAAIRFRDEQLGIPVLIKSERSKELPEGIEMVSLEDDSSREQCGRQLFENRKHKGLSLDAAVQALDDPLLFASTLVKTGFVDGSVAGSIATTASVIRAGLYGIGVRAGRKVVSSFFLMQLDDRAVTYADCGVVPDPTAEQLAEIAIASAESHLQLTGENPFVAMLSFSTKGSAEHPRIEKVRQALNIAKSLAPELAIDGELQFDAAFVPEIAMRKAPESEVAGRANVFVFPDLDSGNIAYKITERLAGATALGPLIQGLEKPFMDLSRGCSVSDVVDVAVIASVLACGIAR